MRIEFFGDLIESMRRFDVESQRSVLQIKETALLPLLEYPKSRKCSMKSRTCAGERVAVPGEEFPGWEYWVPVARPRSARSWSCAGRDHRLG